MNLASKRSQRGVALGKIVLFVLTLYLFVLAIVLMKDGARSVAPLVQNHLSVNNPANSLGLGWLSSYLVLSGSPVAATALTFFDAGAIDQLRAYTMVAGSRFGASFIVLLIGFLYVLRGRDRTTSLSMGLLSMTVTVTTYLPALFLGAYIMQAGFLRERQMKSSGLFHAVIDSVIEPIAGPIVNHLPGWVVFLVGLGIILISFNLFDRCLPQMALKESQVGRVSRVVYHPLVMFTLGAAITMVSMSVSLSLSILVPLSHRGFVRRENVIPYIMGANITTFIDTLLAAALLDNHAAVTLVLAGMLSIGVVSILILLTVYRPYQRRLMYFVDWVTSNNRNMAWFIITLFIIPIILMVWP
jgi:sodium-dependent phosphate cotransporter